MTLFERISEDLIGFPPKICVFLVASVLFVQTIGGILRKIKYLINATWWKPLDLTYPRGGGGERL